MKFNTLALTFFLTAATAVDNKESAPKQGARDLTNDPCKDADGFSKYPYLGKDSSERLLLREGVIDEIPSTLCGHEGGKNVILVVGDGMGWEMVRAGAIAKMVIDEIEEMGINTKKGTGGRIAREAKEKFAGRTLDDYYTEGPGSGLSFQDRLSDFKLMTTTTTVTQFPNAGNHYAPAQSLLEGSVQDHDDGMAPLAVDECGYPIDFSPLDFEDDGGNMVLWNDDKGGKYPWDKCYFEADPYHRSLANSSGRELTNCDDFDLEYIMQHATDSASTAGCMATGHKGGVNMMSVDLFEEDVSTLVEDAQRCNKAGGVVTSVQMLHATPGAFITHTNARGNRDQLRHSFEKVNPTMASGVCSSSYYPFPETLESMKDGALSSQWTFLYQEDGVHRNKFYKDTRNLDPDNGDHLLVCLGGDFTPSGPSGRGNLPYRGVDSSYHHRYCSSGEVVNDPDTGEAIGVEHTTTKCNHYEKDEVKQIPTIAKNVEEAVKFLSKADEGFISTLPSPPPAQIDWAAHANHMDDMLGTMLDVSDSIDFIIDWIEDNGGWEKNALYVTADHDHYLTLLPHFPEVLAKYIIDGESHKITPERNSNVNPWSAAIRAGRHEDDSKTQTEHIKDFTTWTEKDIEDVGHYWGPAGSGGNGWGSHSTRPVGLYYQGDDGCLDKLTGAGFQVVGREVEGVQGKVDQIHLHACMLKNLFGL